MDARRRGHIGRRACSGKAAQDANLEMLLAWIRDYQARTDMFSLSAHRALFHGFPGEKIELVSREAIAAFE
jgi:hypothetical protein